MNNHIPADTAWYPRGLESSTPPWESPISRNNTLLNGSLEVWIRILLDNFLVKLLVSKLQDLVKILCCHEGLRLKMYVVWYGNTLVCKQLVYGFLLIKAASYKPVGPDTSLWLSSFSVFSWMCRMSWHPWAVCAEAATSTWLSLFS